jgi:DNA-binding PadR family transcriptional regulator
MTNTPRSDPAVFLPLRDVELSVLLSVVDRPRHGYAILQEADARSGGRPGFEIPTLYRALRRMRDQGLVEPASAPPEEADEDARREYWRATRLGRQVLMAELRRLETLLSAGRERLAGEGA